MLKTVSDVEQFMQQKEFIIVNNAKKSDQTIMSSEQKIVRVQLKKPSKDTLERIIAKIKRI